MSTTLAVKPFFLLGAVAWPANDFLQNTNCLQILNMCDCQGPDLLIYTRKFGEISYCTVRKGAGTVFSIIFCFD
jgi:hypothetical protein